VTAIPTGVGLFLKEVAVLDVFRFAWFAVRTFFGLAALILTLHGAMWVFVKIHSAAMGNADPDAALRRVMSYNAQGTRHADGKVATVSPAGRALTSGPVNQTRTDEHARVRVR
jgi:hypothetical protein